MLIAQHDLSGFYHAYRRTVQWVSATARDWLMAVVSVILGCAYLALPADANQVWLSGVDPVVRHATVSSASSDYLALFQADAPWPHAASHVQVFKTSTQFLAHGTDEQLRVMFDGLKSRHIVLGMEALMLPKPQNCGLGVEGYSPPATIGDVLSRVQRLGGDLRYVAMDEPLWFGHHYSGPQACHQSIATIAQAIAGQLAVIHRYFPHAALGDIEPFAVQNQPADWMDEIAQWLQAYHQATGQPLAFFDTDTDWHQNWRPQYQALARLLHSRGTKFGIIYDGDADDRTGIAWTRHAEERFVAVEADPALIPDQAILQTWMQHPAHMLPETQPGTMTWLVDRYAAAETRITVSRQGNRVVGQLTGQAGRPIPGVPIQVSAVDVDDNGSPSDRELTGLVPSGAATAVFVLRANTECDCSGPVNVRLGPVSYRDQATHAETQRSLPQVTSVAHSGSLFRLDLPAGRPAALAAAPWPVIPGHAFTIRVAMGATAASQGSGYVALIFLDKDHKELQRLRIPFQPARDVFATIKTGPAGRFQILPNPEVLRQQPALLFEFDGDSDYRLSSACLQ